MFSLSTRSTVCPNRFSTRGRPSSLNLAVLSFPSSSSSSHSLSPPPVPRLFPDCTGQHAGGRRVLPFPPPFRQLATPNINVRSPQKRQFTDHRYRGSRVRGGLARSSPRKVDRVTPGWCASQRRLPVRSVPLATPLDGLSLPSVAQQDVDTASPPLRSMCRMS